MKKLIKQIALVIAVALLLGAVGGSVATAAKKAKISNSKLTLKVGQTKKISVKNLKKKQKKKVKWSSSNKKVASVNKSGKITAKKKGTAKITAKVGKKKYTCKVTVKAKSSKVAPTPVPKTKEQLAKEDRENLTAMVKKWVAEGAKISTDINDSRFYLWNDDGRLDTIRVCDLEGTEDYGVKGKIDVTCFTALERLELDNNRGVTEVNVKGITTLKYLGIGYTSVKTVDVSTNPNLESIYCNKDTNVVGAKSTVKIGRW